MRALTGCTNCTSRTMPTCRQQATGGKGSGGQHGNNRKSEGQQARLCRSQVATCCRHPSAAWHAVQAAAAAARRALKCRCHLLTRMLESPREAWNLCSQLEWLARKRLQNSSGGQGRSNSCTGARRAALVYLPYNSSTGASNPAQVQVIPCASNQDRHSNTT